MRILATNPDTIGDVLLRQPLYAALQQAGHELTLLVRPLLVPVIGSIVPGAKIVTCDRNLYDPRLSVDSPELEPIVRECSAADPELLVVAPYQWTVLEERLSMTLRHIRTIAMSGRLYSDPTYGPAPASRLRADERVSVSEDVPEIRKNELLAGAVLGSALRLPDPALTPDPAHLAAADRELARLWLEPGGYWAACVGDTRYTSIRNWRTDRWSALLGGWAKDRGRKFLLIGHESEAETSEAVRRGMGDQSGAAVSWCGSGEGDLDVMIGLIARSAGYVGRDTGPMHIAAALCKPVLAVFGGGTWPRFLPAADPSVSISMGVPCVGCGWHCHLSESFCIKEVPVEVVRAAAEELESGRVRGGVTRLLKPETMLLARIGREGAQAARKNLTELSVTRRETMEQNQSLATVLERALKQAGRVEMISEELESARAEFTRREAILKQRLAAAEGTFKARESELTARISELESTGATRARAAAVQSESAEKVAAARAAESDRVGQLQSELARASAELLRARAEASDLRLKLTRMESDQKTLSTLTRQQEGEVVVLRERLNDLMSSRWRRYGQRLGLCMTMPWEKELSNGKH